MQTEFMVNGRELGDLLMELVSEGEGFKLHSFGLGSIKSK
jgi:hypothetical protein